MTRSIAASSAARGPRGEEARRSGCRRARASSSRCAVLGVHDHQRAEPGGLLHRQRERLGLEVAELLDAGVEQEALEAEDARVVQRPEVGQVAGHRAAPEADVDADLPLGRPPAWSPGAATVVVGGIEFSGMSRIVVTPPAAAAAGRGGEPLPLGAAGLVDVHVGVDQAGQQHLVVLERRPSRAAAGGSSYAVDGGDPLARDPDARPRPRRRPRSPGGRGRPGRRSAATVGRVAVGAEQHRHVVVLVGVGDREHDDHLGVEARRRRRRCRSGARRRRARAARDRSRRPGRRRR